MDFKKVALDQVHRDLGAKMVPFAGYEMPVRYSSDIEEHMQVRKSVGVFDVSHNVIIYGISIIFVRANFYFY